MITTGGSVHIKRYLAEEVTRIARSISFGIGHQPAAVNDSYLQFETVRSDINLTAYDFIQNKIIYKASVPPEFEGYIYEVGLWSTRADQVPTDSNSKLLTTFDSATETWSAGTFDATNTRIGIDSLRIAPTASATVTSVQSNVFHNLSLNPGSDVFLFAFNASANVSSVRIRFMTDFSNYYQISTAAPVAGYHVISVSKGAAVVTGNPSWGNITMIEVAAIATAGGTATVDFDGLRIQSIADTTQSEVLVSRSLLPTPLYKAAGTAQDIEFGLDVTLS